MFGKSTVEAIRHAANAHEAAADGLANTAAELRDAVDRIELVLVVAFCCAAAWVLVDAWVESRG